MSVMPQLKVPPTVALPRMLIEQDCVLAAEQGLASLHNIKQFQAQLRNQESPKEITKGVVKLGFSWEALDVKFWEGQHGLVNALSELTRIIEISQELTGQPHDMETLMLQEFVEHDLEMRLYVVEGRVEEIIYTKFCKIKKNLEFGSFEELSSAQTACRLWMGGDMDALECGERLCKETTAYWLAWVETQICGLPPAIRFDYFVGRGAIPGTAIIHTLEICELGFSMLCATELPDKVFAAMLRSCLGFTCTHAKKKLDQGDHKEGHGGDFISPVICDVAGMRSWKGTLPECQFGS